MMGLNIRQGMAILPKKKKENNNGGEDPINAAFKIKKSVQICL